MSDSVPDRGESRRANTSLIAGSLVCLVALGVVGAVVLGVGPVADAGSDVSGGTPVAGSDGTGATEQAASDGASAGDDTGANDGERASGESQRPFDLDVEDIEECGRTCRDVTVGLTNNGANERTNVTVATTLYAGDEAVWNGKESVGALASEESTTETRRVKLGFVAGAKIQRNDGVVTVETVVRWDGGSATYREDREVA